MHAHVCVHTHICISRSARATQWEPVSKRVMNRTLQSPIETEYVQQYDPWINYIYTQKHSSGASNVTSNLVTGKVILYNQEWWYTVPFVLFSLDSPGGPGTHSIEQARVNLKRSACLCLWVLGLKSCATTVWLVWYMFVMLAQAQTWGISSTSI